MKQDEHIINLDLPAHLRWSFLHDYKREINELLQCFLDDFQDADFIFESISSYQKIFTSDAIIEEAEFIASISNFSPDQVLTANLYYDILKFYLGCTAFAFESQGKIIHSRNLDWITGENLLSKYSKIFNFQKNGKTVFKTVSWPGFIGSLSGIKPGKFSLTLNAVSSNDEPEIAFPVTFLLREILEFSDSFEEAKTKLENTKIASDCLILLSGVQANEMIVIERTPTKFATRTSQDGFIIVTNDYKEIDNQTMATSELQSTSCGRYDKTHELLKQKLPSNFSECLDILKNEQVMMGITVQQMVFENKTGEIELIKVGV